mmetsp:Transcript_10240/g.19187  ORF Transcript_10240/g.19187 Transcript_10240/m.19187 type:complete len:195 (-) Transcript_10240:1290-1874(-)
MTSRYVAKYPFNGNPAQAQLSFPVGAMIVARDGQEGKPWYWGNYMGRDGWFPPTYVTKMDSAPPPAAPAQTSVPVVASIGEGGVASASMQQRMANISFTSSTARMQPRVAQVQPQPQQQVQQPMMPSSNLNHASTSNVFSGFGMAPQQQQQQQQKFKTPSRDTPQPPNPLPCEASKKKLLKWLAKTPSAKRVLS